MSNKVIKKSLHKKTRSFLVVLTYIVASIMSLVMIAFWVRMSFWLELFVSYLPQLMLLSVALVLMIGALQLHRYLTLGFDALFSVEKSHKVAAFILAITMLHNFLIPFYFPSAAASSEEYDGPTISVLTLNKLFNNEEFTQISNYIKTRSPDILAVQEIFKEDAKIIAQKLGYSHWHIASCKCSAYGSDLAIFSRFPIENYDIAFEDRLGGALRAEIVLGHENHIVVYVVHLVPPYSPKAYSIRPSMLQELASQVNAEVYPVTVLGDFSSSMYSTDMRTFISNTDESISVSDNRPWPKCSWFKYTPILCVRIDHIFVPHGSVVKNQEIGPFVGSDHRPIYLEFSFQY